MALRVHADLRHPAQPRDELGRGRPVGAVARHDAEPGGLGEARQPKRLAAPRGPLSSTAPARAPPGPVPPRRGVPGAPPTGPRCQTSPGPPAGPRRPSRRPLGGRGAPAARGPRARQSRSRTRRRRLAGPAGRRGEAGPLQGSHDAARTQALGWRGGVPHPAAQALRVAGHVVEELGHHPPPGRVRGVLRHRTGPRYPRACARAAVGSSGGGGGGGGSSGGGGGGGGAATAPARGGEPGGGRLLRAAGAGGRGSAPTTAGAASTPRTTSGGSVHRCEVRRCTAGRRSVVRFMRARAARVCVCVCVSDGAPLSWEPRIAWRASTARAPHAHTRTRRTPRAHTPLGARCPSSAPAPPCPRCGRARHGAPRGPCASTCRPPTSPTAPVPWRHSAPPIRPRQGAAEVAYAELLRNNRVLRASPAIWARLRAWRRAWGG